MEKIHRIKAQRSNTKGMAWTAFSANLARDLSFLSANDNGSYIGNSLLSLSDNALRAVGTFDDGDEDEP